MFVNDNIKVLICDDSAILRRLTKQALSSNPRMTVVSEAANGKEALENIRSSKPDVVILDVEMPVMDGVDALREIRRQFGNLPVIMFSSITVGRQSEATIDALAAGANDFVAKPASVGSLQSALKQVGRDLQDKIIAFTNKKAPAKIPMGNAAAAKVKNLPLPKTARINVIGIGSSTGGPKALATVVESLSPNIHLPIIITQHMPATFVAPLADRLNKLNKYEVRPAVNNEELKPGRILIAPGDKHLCLNSQNGKVFTVLDNGPPVHSCRPAVDRMFDSIAKTYKQNALGVVLTGMGKDGRDGCAAIKQAGGVVFAQDEATSVVYGMPREVVDAGLADRILAIEQVGIEISQLASHSPRNLVGALSSK